MCAVTISLEQPFLGSVQLRFRQLATFRFARWDHPVSWHRIAVDSLQALSFFKRLIKKSLKGRSTARSSICP